MNGNLEVTVFDGLRYRRVTGQAHGLKFTKSAPGGNKDASCNLWVDPAAFPDLGPTDRLIIDDARGFTLWDGYLNNPGEQTSEAGLGFDISALGGMVLASDRSERFIWRDTSLDNWAAIDAGVPGTASIAAATREVGSFPDDAGTHAGKPGVFLQFPRGMFTRSGGVRAVMGYPAFQDSVHAPGAFQFFTDQGGTSTDYQVSAYFGTTLPGATTPQFYRDISGVGETVSRILPRLPVASDSPLFLILWSGNNLTIPSDNIWAAYGDMAVLGQTVDRYGQWKQNPRTSYILASEVAEDLLGRILTGCDATTADIAVSSYPIDSLAYLDATTPATVFDDLLKFEPDFDWGIGAMLPNGRHRFWFRKWATEPRYVLDDRADIELPGSDDTLCNRVPIVWTDEAGINHIEIVTAVVPELDAVGRTRDAEVVTLPDGLGSQANAQTVGAAVLQNANARKVSGSAVVTRPILDRLTGRYVMPWELEPGWPVRLQVKGIDVRVTEMEYDDDSVAATLTLNTPERDTDDVLTELKRGAA